MGKPSPKELKEIFRQAAEIASAVPETMHEAAFNRALDQLMGIAPLTDRTSAKGRETVGPQTKPKNTEANEMDLDQIDRTRYPEIKSSLSVLDRSLWALKVANEVFDVDGLTPADISNMLTKKFRIATTKAQVSDKLGKAGSLVNRKTAAHGGFIYYLMEPGETHLGSPKGKPDELQHRRKSRRLIKSSRKPAHPKSSTDETKPPQKSSRRTGGRPGPRAMLERLLTDGFFAKGQTIASIISHARVNLAHTYKPTDLSPALTRLTRDQKLVRTKNQDGQYEYSKK